MTEKSFDDRRIADGYAKDRPYLHLQVIETVKRDLGLCGNVPNGLDIGCGAGLSAKALKAVCGHVTGTDISPEMIGAAKELCGGEGFSFYACRAEELPVGAAYDIVTAAGVVNWVDQGAFLGKMHQVMNPGSPLVIYDFWITDRMRGVSAYTDWWHTLYLPKFPKPFRKENRWTDEEVGRFGFQMKEQKEIELAWEFDLDAFVRFMLIQSNVNEQIQKQNVSETEAGEWFCETLRDCFAGKARTLVFQGYIWIIVQPL